MLFFRNITALVLAALVPGAALAQSAPSTPATGPADFVVFLGGTQAGSEQVNVARSGGNWIITSSGRIAGPVSVTNNRFEVKYTPDWQPLELHLEGSVGGKPIALNTSFGMTTAVNEFTQTGFTSSKTDQISARTIVLPNNFYAAYEALAARLADAQIGAELPAYIAPQAEIKVTVKDISAEKLASPGGTREVRRYDLVFHNPGGPLPAAVTIDDRHRLARVDIPAAGLSVVRSDLAAVSVRPQTARNPTDTDVNIPANGFSLAGTITTPPDAPPRQRHPAVILVPGSGPVDREANVAGIPIFTQLAGSLAKQGFVVLRYDKRAIGQSGGRDERATINDYAEDLRAAVRFLRKRDDVDKDRVAVAGHSEGGAVAMIAAAKTDDIASLVLIAAPGTTGSDLILEQQQHVLSQMDLEEHDRQARIDLQRRIQTAVLTGIGWQGIPPELRKQADTPWFKSLLAFDPAQVMRRIEQPVLIVQGELDKQVFPHHADKLAALARARNRKEAVDVIRLPGVNHLLVKAATGEVSEYGTLPDKTIVPDVADTIGRWLKQHLN